MINETYWVDTPVGHNLEDHVNVSELPSGCITGPRRLTSCQTDTVVEHPSVVFYDFYEAYDNPNVSDENLYLSQHLREAIRCFGGR